MNSSSTAYANVTLMHPLSEMPARSCELVVGKLSRNGSVLEEEFIRG